MKQVNSSFLSAFSSILKIYFELKKLTENKYRLIEMKHIDENTSLITIQVIGKAATFQLSLDEVINDENFLEGFSKKDIRLLTQHELFHKNPLPKYKIIGQEICRQSNRLIYKLKHVSKGETLQKTASELSTNKNLIKELKSIDALNIGYMAGYEKTLHDNDKISK